MDNVIARVSARRGAMDELEHDLRWPDASEAAQLAAIREELAELLAPGGSWGVEWLRRG